jgi:glyoxylase-like metal-dependent hydrolase (beta-lactamase superfamily II)
VAFFRKSEGVLIAGDAVLTVNFNSLWDLLLNRQRVSGPLYISTWNWKVAKESVAALAALEPRVLACGHGIAMIGSGTARELCAFSDRFSVSKRELPH